jgi:hypothetical protein
MSVMFANHRLMARQGMGGLTQSESRGVGSDRVAVSAERYLASPHPAHRVVGLPRKFSPHFPDLGFDPRLRYRLEAITASLWAFCGLVGRVAYPDVFDARVGLILRRWT